MLGDLRVVYKPIQPVREELSGLDVGGGLCLVGVEDDEQRGPGRPAARRSPTSLTRTRVRDPSRAARTPSP